MQFGSGFYDLEEKEQIKRMNYFLRRYSKLVALITDDENIERKRELLEKQKEIQSSQQSNRNSNNNIFKKQF